MIGAHYPALNGSQVAKLLVPVCPLEKQRHIVNQLNALSHKTDTIIVGQEVVTNDLGEIIPSMLDLVYKGKL